MIQYSAEAKPLFNSFMSVEKNLELVLKKLFENNSYSNYLKALLTNPTKDCLSQLSIKEASKYSVAKLIKENYISYLPAVKLEEFENMKSYIKIQFANFYESKKNPEFRDVALVISVYCNEEIWDLGNYQLRPIKILGYIDGLLNDARLSGIGQVQFVGCERSDLSYEYPGYSIVYKIVSGGEDKAKNDVNK